MPTYEITIPGKGTFEVTSEKELTDQQAYQYALSQAGGEQKAPAPKTFRESLGLEPFTESVARGMFADPALAIGQLISRGLGVGQQTVDKMAAENEQRISQAPMGGVGRFIGNVFSPAVAPLAQIPAALSRVPGLAGSGVVPTAVKAAVTGGVGAPLMAPATGEDFAREKAIQTGMGAALGPVFDIAAAPLARLGTPAATPELAALQRSGVDVTKFTPGQQLGGAVKRFEESARSIPVVGSFVKEAETRSLQEFNRGLIQSAIDKVNPEAKIPGAVNTRGAIGFAEKEISKSYNEVLSKMKIAPDPAFRENVTNIVTKYSDELGEDSVKRLEKLIDNKVLKLIPADKTLAGNTAKRIDADLGRQVSLNLRSQDPQDFTIGKALSEVQQTIRGMIANQDPTGQIAKANNAFADFLRLQTAAAKSRRDDGIFSAEQLIGAVRELDPTRRKGTFAKGEARMQQAAEAGRSVLGTQVPDSGTAERLTSQAVLAGLGGSLYSGAIPEMAIGPMIAGGGLAAMYSRPGQFVTRQIAPLGPGLRSVAPIVGPATVQSLLD